MATANLMWIGNTDQLNLNPNTNIPQGQANVIKGWTAEGKDEIKAIEVEGNDYNSGSRFHTSYQGEPGGWGGGRRRNLPAKWTTIPLRMVRSAASI